MNLYMRVIVMNLHLNCHKIQYLNLGSYNQILEPGLIPNSVTKLVFEDRFNQPLFKDSLPNNLKCLILGHNWILIKISLGCDLLFRCDRCEKIKEEFIEALEPYFSKEFLYAQVTW